MKIKVYQINADRDKNRVKFEGLENTEQYQGFSQIDSSIYDEVYDGEVDCKGLESVYTLLNTDHPPFYRGHSLSVSDIVQTEDGHYFCDSTGFERVDYNPDLPHKPDDLLRVVAVEPGKSAYEAEIADTLRAFQQAVQGNIEVFCPFDEDNAVIVCNEEGKILDMPPNHVVNGELLVGNIVIAGDDGNGNFCSLTDDQTQTYLEKFSQPEFVKQDESGDMDSGIQMF